MKVKDVCATKTLLELDSIELSLLETLDHVLNSGLVIAGEITISVANIDLIFIGLNVLVGSVEGYKKCWASASSPPSRRLND